MFSIIEQAGFQYKVTPGELIKVPRIDAVEGSEIVIENVLLAAEGETVLIGTPHIENASVTAKVVEHAKSDKILIVKKKRRKDYQRKNGHRQPYTTLEILSINAGELAGSVSQKPEVVNQEPEAANQEPGNQPAETTQE
jgi:large subunit ribosomal protein L21